VLDSRGNPTVEVEMWSADGISARAMVPSGVSTGMYEAVELRDGDKSRYMGKGVTKAVENVNGELASLLLGKDSEGQEEIDKRMIELDGTKNKGRLGANAILGVSMAVAHLSAKEKGVFLYEYWNPAASTLPLPMMVIMEGGLHGSSSSGLEMQEFMILPVGATSFKEALRMGSEIFHNLEKILKDQGLSTAVGIEGGFSPNLPSNEVALDNIVLAIERAGYKYWKDVMIALDCAASDFFDKKTKKYKLKVNGKFEELSGKELVAFYDVLLRKYPIISIEDGHDENDWDGWNLMMKDVGKTIQVVGDDLLVTNLELLNKAIGSGAANSILVKLNQIGTVTEARVAVEVAKRANWGTVVSHRGGETEDTTIADFAVGMETGQIKAGSLSRTDRICKYNQLLRIEEHLGDKAVYAGGKAFYNLEKGYEND